MGGWSPVKVAIVCGGSDGRAAVERRVMEKGFTISSWAEFLHDLAQPHRTVLDFETRADEGVPDLGAWKYAAQPSNEILCVAWSCRPEPSGRRVLVAHNTAFEQAHMERHIPGFILRPEDWSCTASRARRLSLPGSLEGACNAMRTPHRKSVEGHRVMLQVCQPRPQWANQGVGDKWYEDADRLAVNAIYCAEDILAERDLDDALPELSAWEREVWLQIERGNRRGLRLDVELIAAMEPLIASENQKVLDDLRQHIGDIDSFLTSPAKVREFLATRGLHIADLRKETVEAVLSGHRTGRRSIDILAVKVLEGRQIVGKSSNAKLPAMRARLQADGFARDYAIYFGAHTGRQTGAAVNPLNMPKPYKGYKQGEIIDILRGRDTAALAALRVPASLAVSASLRGTIVAPPGKKLVIGDYRSIEPCVTFTLAGQWDAVNILRTGGDLYCETAGAVYRREITKKNEKERALGKALVLGCTYGLGADKFVARLALDGVDVDEELARHAHGVFRTRFPKVKELWTGLEQAAKAAVRNPGRAFAYGVINYIFDGFWLVAKIPGDDSMFYPNARLEPGKFSDELVYDGRGLAGAWGPVRTWGGSVTENLSQKISRRITMEDKLECERRYGWHVPLDVYDEVVAECDENDEHALEKLYAVMKRPRPWMPEIPIDAEGFVAYRYRKE